MTKQKTPTTTADVEGVSAVLAEGAPQGASGEITLQDLAKPTQQELANKQLLEAMADGAGFTVTIPQVGAYRTQDHRYYWNGKGPYPSVTTILQVLDKPAVVQWAKRTVAEGAVNRAEEVLARTLQEPHDQVVKWLAGMPDYVKDEAGKLGTGIHLLADMVSRGADSDSEGFQPSEQEKPYLDAFQGFLRFLQQQGAEIVSSEKMVWSVNGYAGTYDLIVRFPIDGDNTDQVKGELWLLDIKTSKGYYPEYALQLIAYGYADQIILEGNPDGYPMPHINRYGVLHLRPELYPDTGYRLVEYPLVEADYIAFLAALELYRWKQEGRYTKSKLRKP